MHNHDDDDDDTIQSFYMACRLVTGGSMSGLVLMQMFLCLPLLGDLLSWRVKTVRPLAVSTMRAAAVATAWMALVVVRWLNLCWFCGPGDGPGDPGHGPGDGPAVPLRKIAEVFGIWRSVWGQCWGCLSSTTWRMRWWYF